VAELLVSFGANVHPFEALNVLFKKYEKSQGMIWPKSRSISSSAQYAILQKIISHPSLVIYFFATPPIKLKLGHQIGGGLLMANHLNRLLQWANQKHSAAVRSYLLHSFLQEMYLSPCCHFIGYMN
jgi:hypothetical protein